jgi:hypothetical protein
MTSKFDDNAWDGRSNFKLIVLFGKSRLWLIIVMEGEGGPDARDPEEVSFGFFPSHPELVIPEIQKLSLENRTIGFEALVNLVDQGATEDLAPLIEQGVMALVISQLNDSNRSIIGLVATALRRLSSLFPDEFQARIGDIPFPFLLNIPNCPEVIDFLERSVCNFDSFASALLACGDVLATALGNWLQAGEATAHPSLELIYQFAQIPSAPFDFACVRPFLDDDFPTNIRALTANILRVIDSANSAMYHEILFNLFYTQLPSPTVIQIMHDLYLESPRLFVPQIEQVWGRLLDSLSTPDSAILLADLAPKVPQDTAEAAITQILAQDPLLIERVDAVFRICGTNDITLPQPLLMRLAQEMAVNDSGEVLQCIEAILMDYTEFFADPEAQELLFKALQRPPEFAIAPFKLCLLCCAECPIAPPLLEAFHEFATEFESELSDEFHSRVAAFLSVHQ